MKKGIFIAAGVFLALALGAIIIMRKPQTGSQNQAGPTATPTETSSSGSLQEGAKEIQVVGNEYSFTPSSISLAKGDKVSLTFRNAGKFSHNLTISGLGVATKTITSGLSDTIEFSAAESGTFSFYCSIDGHRGMGMEGSLEVK